MVFSPRPAMLSGSESRVSMHGLDGLEVADRLGHPRRLGRRSWYLGMAMLASELAIASPASSSMIVMPDSFDGDAPRGRVRCPAGDIWCLHPQGT